MSEVKQHPVRTTTMIPRPRPEPRQATHLHNSSASLRPIKITYRRLEDLLGPARAVRRAAKGQTKAAAALVRRTNFVPPFLISKASVVLSGFEFLAACQLLEIDKVPVIVVDDLPDAEIRALSLALQKLPERAEWDMEALAAELQDLIALDPTVLGITGFEIAEVDRILSDFNVSLDDDGDDDLSEPSRASITRLNDLWVFDGGARLLCGNARDPAAYKVLLGSERVQMGLTDPPFGCPIKGHVSRSHREFVEGSAVTEAEILTLFQSFLEAMTPWLADGAIVDLFIDAQGMLPLLKAVKRSGLALKTLVTWDKGAGGMGSLYRQQAEYVLVTKWGEAPHINNIELGKYGRNRTTVWTAPGLAQFGKGRKETLALHPTVKPVGLLFDAVLDTSMPGGIVLDPFAGSGSTLLAAHRAHRRGRAIELDPLYVDVAVTRMEKLTGKPARLAETGRTFAETAAERGTSLPSNGGGAIADRLPSYA